MWKKQKHVTQSLSIDSASLGSGCFSNVVGLEEPGVDFLKYRTESRKSETNKQMYQRVKMHCSNNSCLFHQENNSVLISIINDKWQQRRIGSRG